MVKTTTASQLPMFYLFNQRNHTELTLFHSACVGIGLLDLPGKRGHLHREMTYTTMYVIINTKAVCHSIAEEHTDL